MKGHWSLFYHRFKGGLALLVVQTAKCKCFFKSNMSVPNEIVTKFKAKYQHLLDFFEFVGVNATKVQWCGRKFDHEVILKSKFVTTYRKLCKNIYCNILQYAIEFPQIYYILQYAINGILLHCIFIAIGL